MGGRLREANRRELTQSLVETICEEHDEPEAGDPGSVYQDDRVSSKTRDQGPQPHIKGIGGRAGTSTWKQDVQRSGSLGVVVHALLELSVSDGTLVEGSAIRLTQTAENGVDRMGPQQARSAIGQTHHPGKKRTLQKATSEVCSCCNAHWPLVELCAILSWSTTWWKLIERGMPDGQTDGFCRPEDDCDRSVSKSGAAKSAINSRLPLLSARTPT